MIYRPGRFLFLHLPRTAGSSIEHSIMRRHPEGLLAATCHNASKIWRHNTAAEMKSICTDWDQLWKWAVVRNPWEVIDSVIRRGRRLSNLNGREPTGDPLIDESWDITPREACDRWFGGNCSFWAQYVGQEDVEPIMFDVLPRIWPMLCRKCGYPSMKLMRVNAGLRQQVGWSQEDIDHVGHCASSDVESFDWEPPSWV